MLERLVGNDALKSELGTALRGGRLPHAILLVGEPGCGAGFAARGDCYHTELTVSLIASGIKHQGFSVIDCASICPTYYGRKNGNVIPVDMLRWQRDNLKPVKCGEQFDGYSIGIAFENNYPEYTQTYGNLLRSLAEDGNEA